MTKLDKVATSHNCKFEGVGVFVPLREQFVENITRSYHVYKVIAVLHIYYKILGIRLVEHPANKNKCLVLIKF